MEAIFLYCPALHTCRGSQNSEEHHNAGSHLLKKKKLIKTRKI
jgi:hypothetical protein